MKKIILLWGLILSLIAGGCTPDQQPKADTPKLRVNKQVVTFLHQGENLESLTEQRETLLDPNEEYIIPKIAEAIAELRKKHVQSTEEAAEQQEKLIATELSFYYPKEKLEDLQLIHQKALDFQSQVNSQSGENKALVQQAVNDFVKLTESDLHIFDQAWRFISDVGITPPKYSFIDVAQAEEHNCNCTEISRERVSPTLIKITYRCICTVTEEIEASEAQRRQLEILSKMSLQRLKEIKDIVERENGEKASKSENEGKSPGFKKMDVKEIEKKFELKPKEFHRVVKTQVLTDLAQDAIYSKELKKLGKNPDIHLSEDGLMRIVATDPNRRGKSFDTNWNIKDYRPGK